MKNYLSLILCSMTFFVSCINSFGKENHQKSVSYEKSNSMIVSDKIVEKDSHLDVGVQFDIGLQLLKEFESNASIISSFALNKAKLFANYYFFGDSCVKFELKGSKDENDALPIKVGRLSFDLGNKVGNIEYRSMIGYFDFVSDLMPASPRGMIFASSLDDIYNTFFIKDTVSLAGSIGFWTESNGVFEIIPFVGYKKSEIGSTFFKTLGLAMRYKNDIFSSALAYKGFYLGSNIDVKDILGLMKINSEEDDEIIESVNAIFDAVVGGNIQSILQSTYVNNVFFSFSMNLNDFFISIHDCLICPYTSSKLDGLLYNSLSLTFAYQNDFMSVGLFWRNSYINGISLNMNTFGMSAGHSIKNNFGYIHNYLSVCYQVLSMDMERIGILGDDFEYGSNMSQVIVMIGTSVDLKASL